MSHGIPLVTGATGFAGRHLVAHLLASEARVAAWGNPSGRPVPADVDRRRVEWTTVDVTAIDEVAAALDLLRPSVVYHCAGIADVHSSWSDAARTLRVNVIGTHAVLAGLARIATQVPVVVTGSALVYRPSAEALSEDSPLGPTSPYALSKLAQEMLASATPGHIIVTRPFNHAGPGQSDAYVASSFARQIAEAEAGVREPILRVGNLDARRDITDVRDTVRAYTLLAADGRPHHPYNVCSGRAYRVGELMEHLVSRARVAIRVELDPARLRPSDNPIVLGRHERLSRDTGWKPEIDIERTLDDLLAYWRQAVRERITTP